MEYPKSSKDSGIRVNNLHSAVQVAKTGPVFGKDVFTLVSLIIHTSNPDTVAALQEVGVGGRVPQSEMSPFLPIPVSPCLLHWVSPSAFRWMPGLYSCPHFPLFRSVRPRGRLTKKPVNSFGESGVF